MSSFIFYSFVNGFEIHNFLGVCTLYCLTEEDSRWHEMCNHQLNNRGSSNQDRLMGMEECKSPFGIYELKIPVDNTLECDDDRITHTNCKDLEVS